MERKRREEGRREEEREDEKRGGEGRGGNGSKEKRERLILIPIFFQGKNIYHVAN